MIQFQNVSAGYAGRTVVREVSFTVPRGSVASLIGPNGQGKTTLLRTAGGLLKPQAGRVLLNGKPAGDYRRRELAQLAAVLPQVRETPAITVERLAAHGRYPHLGFGRELASRDRELVEKEQADVNKWYGEYHSGIQLIRLAYERTIERIGKLSFPQNPLLLYNLQSSK